MERWSTLQSYKFPHAPPVVVARDARSTRAGVPYCKTHKQRRKYVKSKFAKAGMKSGRGQKRPAGDSGQKRKMRKANARTAPGRVNRPGKAVNPAQEPSAQKRISDEGPPGSKRLKVADKMPGAKRKKDPPLPTPQDFCRGDASAETEGTYVPPAAARSARCASPKFPRVLRVELSESPLESGSIPPVFFVAVQGVYARLYFELSALREA